ncbi:MAG: efflux RND transporter periplasmic adaptor subunit [Fimbriimonadales bacterium]
MIDKELRPRVGTALLGAVIGALFIAGCQKPSASEAKTEPAKVVDAQVAEVRLAQVGNAFEAVGTVKARLNATLSSKAMARVVGVNVRDGDAIHAGQVLVSLDPRELSSAVQVAEASLKSARAGVDSAVTVADMQAKTSSARVGEARAQVDLARAARNAARAKLDLALAGPRSQERAQAKLAVEQAASNLRLAQTELERARNLVEAGAVARRQLDLAQNAYDVAKAQYDTAVQNERMVDEGSRSQDIAAAKEGLAQAEAALRQAEASLQVAQAAQSEVAVRRKQVDVAQAQVSQSSASVSSARVGLSYATVVAPFDGRVIARLADPGVMASPGVPLLTVEGGEYQIEAIVPENLLGSVQVGNRLSVLVDAIAQKKLTGTVAEVVPQGDAVTRSFVVRVAVPSEPGLKSGMFGRIQIPKGTANRILIPTSATWGRDGLQYVFAVNADGVARLRIVSLGKGDGDKIEVLAGLAPGDRIVVGNRDNVTDGATVRASQK